MHARRAALAVAVSATLLLGLVASSASAHRPPRGDAWRVELLCEGRPCPETTRRGDRWVMGQYGDRYTIRLHNDSDHAVEAVVTVDGRDVVNGRSGSYANRGYIVGAWDSVDIDGWRVNLSQVAAFRFTDVPDSYAGRVDGGRNTGVIGVAFFPERERPVVRPAPIRPNTYGGGGSIWDDEDAPRKSAPRRSAPPRAAKDGRGWGAEPEAAPAGDAAAGRSGTYRNKHAETQGLGTRYGETRSSSVSEVDFQRASSHPKAVVTLRYDDREGLIARGIDPPPRPWTPSPPRVSDRFVAPPPDPFPGRW